MNHAQVLVVDDEPDICELLEMTLRRMKLEPDSAGDMATLEAAFPQGAAQGTRYPAGAMKWLKL